MELNQLHLLGFEKRIVVRVQQIQLAKLNKESQGPPGTDENNILALAHGLIACRAAWGIMAVLLMWPALALYLLYGPWGLMGYIGFTICIGMNLWRGRQCRHILVANGIRR